MSRITVGPVVKKPGEALLIGLDFRLYGLRPEIDEELAGTPTAVEVDSFDLTIDSIAVNTGIFTNERGKFVMPGKGLQLRVAGGVDFADYAVDVECGTDGDPVQTLGVTLLIEVRSSD